MILMLKYKGRHGGKKGQKIRARPSPPLFGQCPKEIDFFMGGVPLPLTALWCYPNVKLEIRNLSLITSTAPIVLQINYFRENIWVSAVSLSLHICRMS